MRTLLSTSSGLALTVIGLSERQRSTVVRFQAIETTAAPYGVIKDIMLKTSGLPKDGERKLRPWYKF